MSLALQTLFTNKNPTSKNNLHFSQTHFSKLPKHHFNSKTHLQDCTFFTPQPRFHPLVAKTSASFQEPYETSQSQVNGASNEFNLDAFLAIIEFFSLASSAAVSVYVAFYGVQKGGGVLWSKVLVWQSVVLVSAVVVGAVIRRRQWRRICGGGLSRGGASSSSSLGSGANLLMRVEKMEEDLRSSATIIRVLSRQLEKLGIRFRVTRKALKEPLAETAALAQKNSEATRALAAQEDILEKELGEIQKVLLAMQEQQQKQLELILAIGKAGKLWETNRAEKKDENASKTTKSSGDGVKNLELNQFETLALQKEANNERP